MTRDEQIKKEALKECSSFDLPDKEGKFKGVNSAYGLGFCEGAIWADETMIDKACDWLLCNSRNYFEASGCCTWINYGKLVDDFKKAMKGE